jgi:peptide/nickel transport system permease protein
LLQKRIKWIFKSKSLGSGLVILSIVVITCAIGGTLLLSKSLAMDYSRILHPPSHAYPFGTDDLGRDVLSRVLCGGRMSIFIGACVVIVTSFIGGAIGLMAGYSPRASMVLMAVMDLLMAFPALLLALAMMASLGASLTNVVIALSLAYTPRVARVVRSVVIEAREKTFIEAARSIGAPTPVVLIRHLLPNALPQLIVQETFIFAYAILGEAALSFVGAGIQPPAASWGSILGDARALIREAGWLIYFPGLAVVFTVLSLNLVGDGLRDMLDPRRKGVK